MAINFPTSPVLNQTFTDSTSGFTFQWNGSVWKSFSASTAAAGQIRALDDISGSFNGVTTSFALTSNSVSITPSSSAALVINLGGVIQDSTDDYSVSASNIIFSTPPTNGLTFSGISLGYVLPNTVLTIADNTTTEGRLNVAGILSATGLQVTGISTLGNTIVGGATTQLIVNGDARITGILTIGTSSLTFDGVNNQINIGTGVTITESGTASFSDGLTVSGVATASSFVGNLTGTATTALNLSDAANITTGTISSDRLTGTYNIDITGSTATATYAVNAGVATYATSSGIATYASVAGIATYATSSGIATYASTAGVATALQNSRTFQITGDIIASPISFDGTGNVSLAATIQPNSVGLGTDTTGDYVTNITGTSNQITVTGGTGEGSTPTLSVPNQFTAPQDVTITRDLQVNRNLNVNGNITIGGTSATIFSQSLNIYDPDIVLGYRTDANNKDVSNDNTANHGGVALASTEGTPLVSLFIAGIETNPATYKKIMWFKSGTFSGLGTDAWLSNYAVGIGSTQFPTGTRLAAGSVQFTQNDLAVVRNINASGVTTSSGFSGNITGTAGTITTLSSTNGTITNLTGTAGTVTTLNVASTINAPVGIVTNVSGSNLNYAGIGTITTLNTTNLVPTNINSSGISTLTTLNTTNSRPTNLNVSGITTLTNATGTNLNFTGVSTLTNATGTNINYSGVGTITTLNTTNLVPTNINSSGIITAARLGINTTSVTQQFQVGSGTTIVVIDSLGDVGIATTNPTSKLHVIGDALITGISTLTTAVVGSAVTINATGVNASGITGIITAKDFRIANVAEKLTIQSGNTVTISYGSSSNVVLASNPSGDITVNVTGVPTTPEFNESILTFSVIVSNTGTARSCTAVTLNGVSRTIQWFGGSLASAVSGVTTIRGYDLYSFTGINTVGSASTTANYVILGNVNGSYR